MNASNDLIRFLNTRRSALAMTLEAPGPTPDEVRTLIGIASRVPDHGKLAPWRFIEYSQATRRKLCARLLELADRATLEEGARQKCLKEIGRFGEGPLAIAVVSQAGDHPKIPKWEQVLSAGAASMNLLIAANAMGFDAQWLTGWHAYDPASARLLGLKEGERFAAIVNIGTSPVAKTERPRPAVDDVLTVFEA